MKLKEFSNEEMIEMNTKELTRLGVLQRLKCHDLTVKEAAMQANTSPALILFRKDTEHIQLQPDIVLIRKYMMKMNRHSTQP